jgi:hypothetical protein
MVTRQLPTTRQQTHVGYLPPGGASICTSAGTWEEHALALTVLIIRDSCCRRGRIVSIGVVAVAHGALAVLGKEPCSPRMMVVRIVHWGHGVRV